MAIDDQLLERAKAHARDRGLTLGQWVEEAIRLTLAEPAVPQATGANLPVFTAGRGLRPGVDASSTWALLEAADEDPDVP